MARLLTHLAPTLLLLATPCLACGGARGESEGARPASAPAETDPPPLTEYRVGDTVTYEYSGAFSEIPVALTETIDRVEGAKLWIRVFAERGNHVRQWIQVVTDTEENRNANVIDELYEVRDGEEVLLSNEDNRDVMRLYEWTLPPCGGPSERVGSESRSVTIADEAHECECTTVTMRCEDRPARMTTCDCPQFRWTHGGGWIVRDGEEEPFWSMRVTDHQRTHAPPSPRAEDCEPFSYSSCPIGCAKQCMPSCESCDDCDGPQSCLAPAE